MAVTGFCVDALLTLALSSRFGSVAGHCAAVEVGPVVAGKDVKYRARISLDQIVSDLKALGNGMFAGPVPLQAAPMEYPPDVVASLFPGADHPVLPVDALFLGG